MISDNKDYCIYTSLVLFGAFDETQFMFHGVALTSAPLMVIYEGPTALLIKPTVNNNGTVIPSFYEPSGVQWFYIFHNNHRITILSK